MLKYSKWLIRLGMFRFVGFEHGHWRMHLARAPCIHLLISSNIILVVLEVISAYITLMSNAWLCRHCATKWLCFCSGALKPVMLFSTYDTLYKLEIIMFFLSQISMYNVCKTFTLLPEHNSWIKRFKRFHMISYLALFQRNAGLFCVPVILCQVFSMCLIYQTAVILTWTFILRPPGSCSLCPTSVPNREHAYYYHYHIRRWIG